MEDLTLPASDSHVFRAARQRLLAECCLPPESLQFYRLPQQSGFSFVIHINTRTDNVLVAEPGKKKILKHIFLSNKLFRSEIVEYYRRLGFSWIDIICVNRVDWKILLWQNAPEAGNQMV